MAPNLQEHLQRFDCQFDTSFSINNFQLLITQITLILLLLKREGSIRIDLSFRIIQKRPYLTK